MRSFISRRLGQDGKVTDSLDAAAAARSAVAVLLAEGLRHVVVAPGSRSAPLAYALAAAEEAGLLELHVRIDERAAGFTALGLALGSGTPVAVATTSGTAVGELLPAVMEANHAAVPLLVLSADRPLELRGTGANQTTNQVSLFGRHVRYAVDVPAGEDPSALVRAGVLAGLGRGSQTARPGVPGPVQLNLAFRDPLVPAPSAWPDYSALPTPGIEARVGVPEGARVDAAEARAAAQPPAAQPAESRPARTVVVAGHGAGPLAQAFARDHRLPLLAEPSSNARYGPNAVGPYRLMLEHLGPAIERVVLFGRPTLSRPVGALLARADVERALYAPAPAAWFEEGRRPERLISSLAELSAFAGVGPEEWLRQWQTAGEAAAVAVQSVLEMADGLTGMQVAEAVWDNSDGNLVLGPSNPIRDADLVAATDWHPLDVYANRGLAGIDGTVATATGIALASGVPTRLLLGDLTFLHDAGALLLGNGEAEPDLQIVVLNDSGGGIFTLLEHGRLGEEDAYAGPVERLFGTPHSVDLSALGAAYGVGHRLVSTLAELDDALAAPISGRSIVEARTSRRELRALHARLRAAVGQAVRPGATGPEYPRGSDPARA
jgi:2-succinyl-5-enolpyruvyl-6-hydroxy-3-cyclohexene-1-carboxylate synthase